MGVIDTFKQEQAIPVVIVNNHAVITYVNEKFVEVFGWEKKEVMGKPITIIIPADLHDAHNLGFSRFVTTEESKILGQPLDLLAMKKDGTIFNAEHFIQGEKINGVWEFGATIKLIEA